MSGSDPLHFEILGGVASQLKDLSCQILQDSRAVHCSSSSNSAIRIYLFKVRILDSGLWALICDYIQAKNYGPWDK